jgi:hypothetical protein
MKITPSVLCAIFWVSSASAQENRTETQALRCGTVTRIHTSLSQSSPAFGTAMGATTQFYSSLYSASRFVRLGVDVTNEEILDRQGQLAAQYSRSWRTNPEPIVQEVALCNTWRAQFASRIVKLDEASTPGDIVKAVGAPPKRASVEQVTKWRPLVNQAFEAWLKKASL